MVDAVPIGPGLIYPDMLPESVWGSNLRGIVSKSQWDELRILVCEKAENRCEVCGQPGYDPESGRPRRPDCHELWRFEVDASSAVQRLARLIALCPDCHRVQHAGLAAVRGELSLVVSQLRAVNAWTSSEIHLALNNADERHQWRFSSTGRPPRLSSLRRPPLAYAHCAAGTARVSSLAFRLVCAAAVASCTKSSDEITESRRRAGARLPETIGIRHLLRWRCSENRSELIQSGVRSSTILSHCQIESPDQNSRSESRFEIGGSVTCKVLLTDAASRAKIDYPRRRPLVAPAAQN